MSDRTADRLVAIAALATAALCLAFRWLPMTDLPQHHAMVSIFAHHGDPAFGFGERFTIDLAGRLPYASVYLLGAALAKVLPLRAAMGIVVALCTLAPLAGAWALLRATGRPRVYALLAVPFLFGHMWHWGFLNFLLGVGLLQLSLALLARGRPLALAVCALLLLLTHLHTFALLCLLAPALAWAWAPAGRRLRALAPLVPGIAAAAWFTLATWRAAEGFGRLRFPGPLERLRAFPSHLAAGIVDPWPTLALLAFAAVAALAVVLRDPAAPTPRRQRIALGAILAAHAVLLFALPLQTATASYVSARQALLLVLAVPLVLPRPRHPAPALACAAFAAASLLVAAGHLARFDAEARDFAPVLARVPRNARVASMILDPRSPSTHRDTYPYLHFAAYAQAERGGDLSFSFASHWNIPVRYRADRPRHPMPPNIEWNPWAFRLERDGPSFDLLLFRSPEPLALPVGLRLVAASGDWALAELPPAGAAPR